MSLYTRGIALSDSVLGPYRQRAATLRAGALDFHRGTNHFYRRGIAVGGVKDGIVSFLIDLVHIMLVVGGVYLVFTSIFA